MVGLNKVHAQYETYIQSLLPTPEQIPQKVQGEFAMKRGLSIDDVYFEFLNREFPIFYYPPKGSDCGYFRLFDQVYRIKGKFEVWEKFGCNLDAQTLEVFHISLKGKEYFFITSIAETSGKGTRDVFVHLFDTSQQNRIVHYPLWSLYGSRLSLGDYNGDERLDFLEVRYDRSKEGEVFALKLKTLSKDYSSFVEVGNSHILFKQEYVNDSLKIEIVDKKW